MGKVSKSPAPISISPLRAPQNPHFKTLCACLVGGRDSRRDNVNGHSRRLACFARSLSSVQPPDVAARRWTTALSFMFFCEGDQIALIRSLHL
uniref:Uncharacterized protein n=1 Tax=Globodera rostochiensis TaxID=31243 RepID=A0A914HFD7_GLORO